MQDFIKTIYYIAFFESLPQNSKKLRRHVVENFFPTVPAQTG